ncbi:hypothetical protein ATANTOWER_027111 [Ataeniobius toweri]|uniref:Ig-like domain-containing protein n=1 Tax=Ataeniobius toweri TaxID=208326 RepID=A0ABU7BF32_9TELE|nr:hypothetical protein [Ataeniobius toweri]
MLNFMIICYVWSLTPDVIDGVENSTGLQAANFSYLASLSPSAVIRFSVLEDHNVCLPCGGSARSNVIWTYRNRKVLVTRQGSQQTNQDRQHYVLLGNGGLCVLKLEDSDSGEYQCNQQLVAELQVLTGHDFIVSAGRTLLLPCRGSSKPKHKWIRQREGRKEEVIFTRFRNGTEKAEIDGSRLIYIHDALQITDLQPEDAGKYLCNRVVQAKLTVLEEHSQPTGVQSSTSITTVSAASKTGIFSFQNNKFCLFIIFFKDTNMILHCADFKLFFQMCLKQRTRQRRNLRMVSHTLHHNLWKSSQYYSAECLHICVLSEYFLRLFSALLLVAVIGLGLMIVLIALVSIFLASMKCRKKRRHRYPAKRREDTELQLWMTYNAQTEYEVFERPSLPDETIHYASLGRQYWSERPSWSPPEQSSSNVVYSSVFTRPAAKHTFS